ncbi:MAG: cation transporter [Kiritimatiellae bacterium]|nr:cation transporter [Kiritimatiellia bacterium]
MKRFTHWVVARTIPDYDQIEDLKVRLGYGLLEGWVSIVLNAVLFAVKFALGLVLGSVALTADAVHTLSDCATSAVIIVGFKVARKPSDREHPFGHGRMEAVASLVVAVLLFVVSAEFLQQSVRRIIDPKAVAAGWVAVLAISLTIVVKHWLGSFAFELGRMIDSKALKADAMHHWSDVWATALVVVAFIAGRFGWPRLDGIMGVGVALIIAYSAYGISQEIIGPLLGEAPKRETLRRIHELASAHEGVSGVHDITVHKYGRTMLVSLHVEVPDHVSAGVLHETAEAIEESILQGMGATAVVHIDPINKDHPWYPAIRAKIQEIVSAEPRVQSFHDLRVVGSVPSRSKVVFDIVPSRGLDEMEMLDVIRGIDATFRAAFPEMRTVIEVEPQFRYTHRAE